MGVAEGLAGPGVACAGERAGAGGVGEVLAGVPVPGGGAGGLAPPGAAGAGWLPLPGFAAGVLAGAWAWLGVGGAPWELLLASGDPGALAAGGGALIEPAAPVAGAGAVASGVSRPYRVISTFITTDCWAGRGSPGLLAASCLSSANRRSSRCTTRRLSSSSRCRKFSCAANGPRELIRMLEVRRPLICTSPPRLAWLAAVAPGAPGRPDGGCAPCQIGRAHV